MFHVCSITSAFYVVAGLLVAVLIAHTASEQQHQINQLAAHAKIHKHAEPPHVPRSLLLQLRSFEKHLELLSRRVDNLSRITSSLTLGRLQLRARITGTIHPEIVQVGESRVGFTTTPYPEYLTVDLREPIRVRWVKLRFYEADDRSYVFSIDTSRDGQVWESLVQYVQARVQNTLVL
jgi:hypothetical protein